MSASLFQNVYSSGGCIYSSRGFTAVQSNGHTALVLRRERQQAARLPPAPPLTINGRMAATVADAAVGSASAGAGTGDGEVPSGSGGGWVEGVDSVKEASDRLVSFVADVLARHGWTAIFLVIVWYNCKDAVKRRYRKWRK